jgi:phosphatidylglycerophosphate synthase
MLDRSARRLIDPALDRAAAVLVRAGVSANVVTVVGFTVGIGACAAIAASSFRTALLLLALNRLADGLDGAVARRTRSTLLGGFLDIVLDTLFYSGVPFAFALARPEFALPAAFLVYSFVGTGGSFLAAAIVAGKHGVGSERKSFHYSVGLMEGTETIAFFVAFCLFPDRFAELAWTFGTLCWITTALRIATTVARFREAESDAAPRSAPPVRSVLEANGEPAPRILRDRAALLESASEISR